MFHWKTLLTKNDDQSRNLAQKTIFSEQSVYFDVDFYLQLSVVEISEMELAEAMMEIENQRQQPQTSVSTDQTRETENEEKNMQSIEVRSMLALCWSVRKEYRIFYFVITIG